MCFGDVDKNLNGTFCHLATANNEDYSLASHILSFWHSDHGLTEEVAIFNDEDEAFIRLFGMFEGTYYEPYNTCDFDVGD